MTIEHTGPAFSWYVIHTNPRQEERANNNLRAWKVETFAPLVKQVLRNQFTGAQSYVVKPLFARYIFARFDLASLFHKIRFTRGVHSVVEFGDGPVPIDEEIISMIKSRIDKDGFVRIGEDLQAGDRVIIKDGPLKDFTGIFEREMNDSSRVKILLNFINYQAYMEIDKDKIKKQPNHLQQIAFGK